jgi:tRNA threonylcarbamoyladenosine biosynthesis protein TsaB
LIVLALDTTTRAGSVAVLDDDRVLALLAGDAARTHAERLPTEFARALDAARVTKEHIDLFAVAIGPGAFTGLRIGLASIQGLAMTLNKPVIGVSALDALVAQVVDDKQRSPSVILPWMDAQRGDVFAMLVDSTSRAVMEAPTASNPGALLEAWRHHFSGRHAVFIGDAVERDADLIKPLGEMREPSALAVQIGQLGRQRSARGEAGPPHTLEPIYVRRPDAEIERERLGRQSVEREGGRSRT